MTLKEQIIQELDQMPESQLEAVLKLVRSLNVQQNTDQPDSKVWQAYLASEQEREEVYRRISLPSCDESPVCGW
ncbi:MAG: DUF2281 domain-containing protein [Leptolyngbyaceae cyanobacterium RU_5_1]|nr:DUF2281 domain-containing protein [Leptolyngbyaceae cyanobacterium RU_5_1]